MPPKTIVITTKGRARRETDVMMHVRDLLLAIGLREGEFVLTITTKLPSSGNHPRGIEIKGIARNAIRLIDQGDSNGSRFECYLSSPDIKPKHLEMMITAHPSVKGGFFARQEVAVPVIPPDVNERLATLRCQTRRLAHARARAENIKLELSNLEDKRRALEKELSTVSETANDPTLIRAEKDLEEVLAILKK